MGGRLKKVNFFVPDKYYDKLSKKTNEKRKNLRLFDSSIVFLCLGYLCCNLSDGDCPFVSSCSQQTSDVHVAIDQASSKLEAVTCEQFGDVKKSHTRRR